MITLENFGTREKKISEQTVPFSTFSHTPSYRLFLLLAIVEENRQVSLILSANSLPLIFKSGNTFPLNVHGLFSKHTCVLAVCAENKPFKSAAARASHEGDWSGTP